MFLGAQDKAPNPLIPHTTEIIVGLIAFGLLYAILARRVFPMFERTFAARSEAIEGGIRRAEEAQAEAQRALEQYRAQLADARGEAQRIREEARVQAQGIKDDILAQAREESARITARGEAQLEADRAQVVTALRADLGRLAVTLAERIVGQSLADGDRQRRTIDGFLDDLESGAAATAAVTAPGGPGGAPPTGSDDSGERVR